MTVEFTDQIEILSVDLLDQQRPLVEELKSLARSLRLEFGWHYLLDQSWILSRLGDVRGMHIMDAGAGTGVIQWYLAEHGAQVVSVDRSNRADLPLRFRRRFNVQGMRPEDLLSDSQAFLSELKRSRGLRGKAGSLARNLNVLLNARPAPGQVTLYHQDLKTLADLPDNSLDAIVSVSALEHNTHEGLQQVVAELMRVLKPGGALVASLNAARDQDWWHTPSSGWSFTDDSLRRLFSLPPDTPSNYDRYDALFTALVNCAELRDNLAEFYSKSGDNGMPWGKWAPKYQPVGICKVK